MRTLKTTFFMVLAFMIIPYLSNAQDNSKLQSYWVHEDVVKPAMVGEYESSVKDLVANMKKFNIPEVNMIVSNLADNTYLYVGPMENMAQLDQPIFATLSEKMGKEAMAAIFKRMDKCYDVEHDYVINLDKELSYMPSGITQTPAGQDYRKFHYLYLTPDNRDLIKEKMKAVKDLFVKKGSQMYYRVYKSGFGTRGEFYMVAIAAKDEVDYAQKGLANQTLLGEEGNQALGDLFSNLLRYEEFVGRMRPELAYAPQK